MWSETDAQIWVFFGIPVIARLHPGRKKKHHLANFTTGAGEPVKILAGRLKIQSKWRRVFQRAPRTCAALDFTRFSNTEATRGRPVMKHDMWDKNPAVMETGSGEGAEGQRWLG